MSTCQFASCAYPTHSKGLCAGHAAQQRAGQPLAAIKRRALKNAFPKGEPCPVPNCVRLTETQGLCGSHYAATMRGGPLNDLDVSPGDWFFNRVSEGENGCWQWIGDINPQGYGQLRQGRTMALAHRWSFEYMRAEIPDGLVIDHLCRNRACVNPWHMEPVTQFVNWARGFAPSAINARKTHCKRGHEFDAANTATRPSGGRRCRACTAAYNRAYSAA